MGNKGSRGGAGAEPEVDPAGSGWTSEEYAVHQIVAVAATGVIRAPGTDKPCGAMRMRIEAEALVFMSEDRSPLAAFPYYSIMCWGHGPRSFQFRVFERSLPDGAVSTAPTVASSTPDGGARASPSPAAESPGAGKPDEDATKPAPEAEAAAAASAAASGSGTPGVDSPTAPSQSMATPGELLRRPGVTFALQTSDGPRIESRLLAAVRMLMTDMTRRGVDEVELLQVTSAIDLDPDRAIEGLRQLALTRRFDAKQARSVVSQVGEVSPFDQVEAAVILYPALMNAESFHVVLGAFEEDDDRANVCLRLGLDVDAVMRGAIGVRGHKARG